MQDCLRLLDGDGAYQHYKYGNVLANEPALDMDVLDVVRTQWNKLRNEESERKWRGEKSASR